MEIKFKKFHIDAKTPTKATDGSAGWDLYALTEEIYTKQSVFDTGIGIQLPKNYVGLIFPRSSISKTANRLINSVGVIDSDYIGSIKFKFDTLELGPHNQYNYKVGDRIGQLIIMPYPEIEWFEVKTLDITDRGEGGFGSTGT